MRSSLKSLAVAGCTLASALAAHANLIVNGSFEDPNVGSGWTTSSSIPGWTSTGNYPIEVGNGNLYGISGWDGNSVMELDSYGNATVSQVVSATAGKYTLSFLFAKRGNGPDLVSSFDVMWNSSLWSFLPVSTQMALFTVEVNALAGSNTLTFVGTGVSNTHGALIDNVQLNRIPDAGSTLAMFGGVIALLGFATRRRM